jgi:DNA-binding response OmpR family regulator
LAEEIRQIDPEMPIIFLTAKSLKEDRIKGFKVGADDYITKPFNSEELSLRIEAILRRYKSSPGDSKKLAYQLGRFTFDAGNQTLTLADEVRHLTRKEAEMLRLLCQNMGQVVRREEALRTIWGEDDYFMGRSMDVYITRLRKYLKDDPAITIANVHGTGFKIEIAPKEN